jgi:hypothetical protein
MGQFTQFVDVNFCCGSGNSILSVTLVEASRSPIGVIQFGGRSSMQALILFRRNIGGIGWNPERENGALLAPRPCSHKKFAHTLSSRWTVGKTCFESAPIVTVAINALLIWAR